MEVTVKEAANKKSSLRFPSLPDKEIRVKGNAKYQKRRYKTGRVCISNRT